MSLAATSSGQVYGVAGQRQREPGSRRHYRTSYDARHAAAVVAAVAAVVVVGDDGCAGEIAADGSKQQRQHWQGQLQKPKRLLLQLQLPHP